MKLDIYAFLPVVDTLRNGYLSLVNNVNYIVSIIQTNFWYIFFGGLLFYFAYYKYISPFLEYLLEQYWAYKKYKEEKDYEAQHHKNPDLFSGRISAQQAYAEKLQEKYNQQLKEHEVKLQQKSEQKRQERESLLTQSSNGGGYRLGNGNEDKKPKSLRSEYNPLMGPGSSSNYRPPKKSKCGGGGCGK